MYRTASGYHGQTAFNVDCKNKTSVVSRGSVDSFRLDLDCGKHGKMSTCSSSSSSSSSSSIIQ